MGYAAGQGTFFQSPRFQRGSFFEDSDSVLTLHILKFKMPSFLVFQISRDMSLLISKVNTPRFQLFLILACVFYLENLSDCVIRYMSL